MLLIYIIVLVAVIDMLRYDVITGARSDRIYMPALDAFNNTLAFLVGGVCFVLMVATI